MYRSMAPERVDLAHPVVGVGADAEAVERVDEDLREVARVATRGSRRPGRARGPAARPSSARSRPASGAPGRPSGRGRRRRSAARPGHSASRRARAIVSTTTGPRRLPTWTVPEGVFESLTTCGPAADAAISSAQNTPSPIRCGRACTRSGPAGAWTVNRVALLEAHQRGADRRLVADPALARARPRRSRRS